MKEFLKTFVEMFIISLLITLVWQGYEILFIGEIKPDTFDTLITIVLTFTIVLLRDQNKQLELKNDAIRKYIVHRDKLEQLVKSQNGVIEEQTRLIKLLKNKHELEKKLEQNLDEIAVENNHEELIADTQGKEIF